LFGIGFRPLRGLARREIPIRRAMLYAIDLEGFQPYEGLCVNSRAAFLNFYINLSFVSVKPNFLPYFYNKTTSVEIGYASTIKPHYLIVEMRE